MTLIDATRSAKNCNLNIQLKLPAREGSIFIAKALSQVSQNVTVSLLHVQNRMLQLIIVVACPQQVCEIHSRHSPEWSASVNRMRRISEELIVIGTWQYVPKKSLSLKQFLFLEIVHLNEYVTGNCTYTLCAIKTRPFICGHNFRVLRRLFLSFLYHWKYKWILYNYV